ncbi:hypothetical protein BU52_22585 [Streptomyces toyocaensis]|uniref:Uncharacterized protein n=1 Tax=Streptomyces toyocaensis TaxID=55952 RepID=A0A081XMR6_STRTO|nr:hypothetical protein [Streptomyces toyocaensis]KES04839.1 hypothetical protein BU52_22585 [Streptomyces toyocaensis]
MRPFAVADEGDRITDVERVRARDAFGIPAAEAAVCLVGGCHKDMDVVVAALARLGVPLHLLVARTPLDHEVVSVRGNGHGRIAGPNGCERSGLRRRPGRDQGLE